DLELLVVGRLREGQTSKLLDELGIRDKVKFVSGLSSDDIAKLYAEATISIAPSVYEGFGFPPGEAMACGVPVIVTDGCALPEVVGDAGIVVPKQNSPALADAIAALLDDPARRAALGAAGLKRIHEKFLWSRTAQNVTQVYLKAIDANRRSQNARA